MKEHRLALRIGTLVLHKPEGSYAVVSGDDLYEITVVKRKKPKGPGWAWLIMDEQGGD